MGAAKTARVNLRIGRDDDALLRRAAEATGESLSQFMVESGRERAERVLADRTSFALSEPEWEAFAAALDRPASVNPAVRDLFARPRPE